MTDSHDPLDDLLRRANPVPPDEPLDPSLASRVMERVRKERTMTEPVPTAPRRLTWRRGLAAAAAVAVGLAAFGISTAIGDDGGSTGPSVALGNPTASCLAFTPEALAMFPVAFDGTVTAIDGDQVTFDVERWYRGGEDDTVTVTAPELVPNSAALVGGIGFEEGDRYLVSADDQDGRIAPAVCGFTVTYSEETAEVFTDAFGG